MLWVLICTMHLNVCYYLVTYAFQSESTLYSCRNVKEFHARNGCDIWSLSDSKGMRIHNDLVRKRTLELCCGYLSVRDIWLFVIGAFDCIWLYIIMSRTRSRVNLQLPECPGTLCSKQVLYLNFKWQQRDSNPEPFSLQTNSQPINQNGLRL